MSSVTTVSISVMKVCSEVRGEERPGSICGLRQTRQPGISLSLSEMKIKFHTNSPHSQAERTDFLFKKTTIFTLSSFPLLPSESQAWTDIDLLIFAKSYNVGCAVQYFPKNICSVNWYKKIQLSNYCLGKGWWQRNERYKTWWHNGW